MQWFRNFLITLFKPIIISLVESEMKLLSENVRYTARTVEEELKDFDKKLRSTVESEAIYLKSEVVSIVDSIRMEFNIVDEKLFHGLDELTNRLANGFDQQKEIFSRNIEKSSKELRDHFEELLSTADEDVKEEIQRIVGNIEASVHNLNNELNSTQSSLTSLSRSTAQELSDLNSKLKLEVVDLLNHTDSEIDELNQKLLDNQKAFFENLQKELTKLGNDKVVGGILDIIKKLDVEASSNKQPFDKALKFTLQWEGGYVNHPNDPGGETNFGVTKATYDAYRKSKKLPLQSVKFITITEVKDIYKNNYWFRAYCDRVKNPNLAIVLFDTAVNFGVRRANLWLQKSLGVKEDGEVGPETLAKLAQADNGLLALRICDYRIAYRHERVAKNPTQQVFLKGWLNRDNALKREIGATFSAKSLEEPELLSSFYSREED